MSFPGFCGDACDLARQLLNAIVHRGLLTRSHIEKGYSMAGVKYGRKSTSFLITRQRRSEWAQDFPFVGTHGGGPLNRASPFRIRQMITDNMVASPPSSTSREWTVGECSKDQLRSQLEHTRIEGTLDLPEVTGALIHADATSVVIPTELSVVPGVEAFSAELETTATTLADHEALEQ